MFFVQCSILDYQYQDRDMEIVITDVGGGIAERQQMIEVFLVTFFD